MVLKHWCRFFVGMLILSGLAAMAGAVELSWERNYDDFSVLPVITLSNKEAQEKTGEVKTMTVIQEGEYFDYKDAGSTYYQWGRKDPIVALRNRDRIGRADYRPLQAAEGYNYDVKSVRTTIGGAIQHPNVYYTRNGDVTTWIESGFNPFESCVWTDA